MKKRLRLISLTLILLMVCFTFCGCTALDEMRAKHAFWKDNEKTLITLNGEEYKLLPECETLSPVCNSYYDYYVTESDVPLLLMNMYGESISLNDDKDFVILENYNDEYSAQYEPPKIYCKTNRYEEISNRINANEPLNNFCYEYETYDLDKGSYLSNLYFLTEEEEQAISTALSQGTISSLYAEEIYADFDIQIYCCSEDALFRKYAFDLSITAQTAYLTVEYFPDDGYTTDSMTIVVPDELYDTFYGIASKYIESAKY